MKPSSRKQDKLQLGDTGDRGSRLNESCLQPSRGGMFLCSPDYPHCPLNRVWLRLHFAKGVKLSLGIESPQLPSTDSPLALEGEEGGAGGLSVSGGTRLHPGKHAEKKNGKR